MREKYGEWQYSVAIAGRDWEGLPSRVFTAQWTMVTAAAFAFLDRVQGQPGFAAQVEYRYQLQVEDAQLASRFERVVFVDASRTELSGGFHWAPCRARAGAEFTTHALAPSAVLHYCAELYGAAPRAELLAVQGYRWELHNGLSTRAAANLEAALEFCGAAALA